MEGIQSLRELFLPGYFMIKLDLKELPIFQFQYTPLTKGFGVSCGRCSPTNSHAYPLVSQVHLAHSLKVMKPLVTSGHWVFGYDLFGQHAEETSRKAKQR